MERFWEQKRGLQTVLIGSSNGVKRRFVPLENQLSTDGGEMTYEVRDKD